MFCQPIPLATNSAASAYFSRWDVDVPTTYDKHGAPALLTPPGTPAWSPWLLVPQYRLYNRGLSFQQDPVIQSYWNFLQRHTQKEQDTISCTENNVYVILKRINFTHFFTPKYVNVWYFKNLSIEKCIRTQCDRLFSDELLIWSVVPLLFAFHSVALKYVSCEVCIFFWWKRGAVSSPFIYGHKKNFKQDLFFQTIFFWGGGDLKSLNPHPGPT